MPQATVIPPPIRLLPPPVTSPRSTAPRGAASERAAREANRRVRSGEPAPLIFPARETRRRAPRALPPAREEKAADTPATGDDWSYSGANGPEFWGRLRPEWRLCSEGKRQSPIDFYASAPVSVDLEPVKFDYRRSRFLIVNAEQRLRVKVTEPMSIEVRGRRYMLEGFTLHRPGESRIDGQAADMEVQFFHRDGNGRIAMLAVRVARGDKPDELLQTLLNNLPLEKGSGYAPDATIDLAAFVPQAPEHFLYMGSLTMPPCTEDVLWVVMKTPVSATEEQLSIFGRLHPGNARPVQPINGRMVLESR